jgi:hypothetical protein
MIAGAIMIVVGISIAIVLVLVNGTDLIPSDTNPHPNYDFIWGIGIAVCGGLLIGNVYFAPIWQLLNED